MGFGPPDVPVFEPVGVTFEAEDLCVVNEPVDHRGGNDLIAEDQAEPEAEPLPVVIRLLLPAGGRRRLRNARRPGSRGNYWRP